MEHRWPGTCRSLGTRHRLAGRPTNSGLGDRNFFVAVRNFDLFKAVILKQKMCPNVRNARLFEASSCGRMSGNLFCTSVQRATAGKGIAPPLGAFLRPCDSRPNAREAIPCRRSYCLSYPQPRNDSTSPSVNVLLVLLLQG